MACPRVLSAAVVLLVIRNITYSQARLLLSEVVQLRDRSSSPLRNQRVPAATDFSPTLPVMLIIGLRQSPYSSGYTRRIGEKILSIMTV